MGSPAAGWAARLAATWAAGLAALLVEGLARGLAALGAGLAGGLAGGSSPNTAIRQQRQGNGLGKACSGLSFLATLFTNNKYNIT